LYFLDNNEESDATKNIKSEIVKQFSDSNSSWLKSKKSKSIIPEKGMCTCKAYYIYKILHKCINVIYVILNNIKTFS